MGVYFSNSCVVYISFNRGHRLLTGSASPPVHMRTWELIVPTKFWADKFNLPISIFDQGGLFTSILKSHLRPWVVIKFDSAFNCSLMLSSCPVFFIIFSCRSCTSKLNILLTKICYNSLTKMDDPEKILNVKNVLKEN